MKVYTPDEVAQLFQISKHTVYELIKRGELQAFKIGNKMRIEQVELDRFKEQQKAPSGRQSDGANGVSFTHSLRLAGSHDLLLEQLIKYASSRKTPLQIQPTFIGSLEGLMMLYRGQCDVAAVHLLDPSSQEYNVPFIHQLFVHEKITVIRFAAREQGFILAKGNPKRISGLKDLVGKDINFVNRQKGSGTRFLFDSLLAREQISPDSISGYDIEEWNHLSASSHITRGSADVTFGIKAAAEYLNLDFIPIGKEQFDFVLKWTNDNQEALTVFTNILTSQPLREELLGNQGYDLRQLGQTILDNRPAL
ncbi:substrate-binding domain-containing protein [Pseudoneobacillus sp. C159]